MHIYIISDNKMLVFLRTFIKWGENKKTRSKQMLKTLIFSDVIGVKYSQNYNIPL